MAKAPDFNEIFRPLVLMGIANEAVQEVTRARKKHGSNADLADGTGRYASILNEAHELASLFNVESTGQAYIPDNEDMTLALQRLNDTRCADGRKHTRLGILFEEAFEAAETENAADLRAELIQVIAMGLDWVADLDQRSVADEVDEACS